jgi:hypothetical protein
MYQRRWGKGSLFMVCILGTFFYGLWIGGGRVVYASFREPEFRDWRWAYVAQVANGLPALPAVVQAIRTGGPNPKAPLFDGFMAPPMRYSQKVPREWVVAQHAAEVEREKAEANQETNPPEYEYAPRYFAEFQNNPNTQEHYIHYEPKANDPVSPSATDQNGQWNARYGAYYDLGTVFTVIAGLLNILAIWDAWGGPLIILPKPKPEKEKKGKDDASENAQGAGPKPKAA